MIPEQVRELEFDGFVFGGGTQVVYEGEDVTYQELSYPLILKSVES